MLKLNRPDLWTIFLLILPLTTACSKPTDERLVELGERANARQQAQNEVIARQAEKTAELTQGFVDAEATARQELRALQQQLIIADAEARMDLQAIHAEVVQRDADGRRELDELHRQTHASIAARVQVVDHQRDLLEQERQQIAAERLRAPVVAEAVKFAGGLIVCVMPLVVVIYLLRSLQRTDDTDSAIVEMFVEEMLTGQRRLLTPPGPSPSLPSPPPDTDDIAAVVP